MAISLEVTFIMGISLTVPFFFFSDSHPLLRRERTLFSSVFLFGSLTDEKFAPFDLVSCQRSLLGEKARAYDDEPHCRLDSLLLPIVSHGRDLLVGFKAMATSHIVTHH